MSLKGIDAGLILRGNGELELEVPDIAKDADTPNNVLIITAMGIMIAENDQRFVSVVNQKIREMKEEPIN